MIGNNICEIIKNFTTYNSPSWVFFTVFCYPQYELLRNLEYKQLNFLFSFILSISFLEKSGELCSSFQVHGIVQDKNGKTVATLFGKWDESMHFVIGDSSGKDKGLESLSEPSLLWKRSKPPKFPTRYNLTRFAITLNELTPGLKVIVQQLSFLHIFFKFNPANGG